MAAVYYLLGERFDADPFLLFVLRGRDQQWVTEALRARRAGVAPMPAGGKPASRRAAAAGAAAPALGDLLDTYWETGALPPIPFAAAELDALAIKRLGAPPFGSSAPDVVTRLKAQYRAISAQAYRVALGEDVLRIQRRPVSDRGIVTAASALIRAPVMTRRRRTSPHLTSGLRSRWLEAQDKHGGTPCLRTSCEDTTDMRLAFPRTLGGLLAITLALATVAHAEHMPGCELRTDVNIMGLTLVTANGQAAPWVAGSVPTR